MITEQFTEHGMHFAEVPEGYIFQKDPGVPKLFMKLKRNFNLMYDCDCVDLDTFERVYVERDLWVMVKGPLKQFFDTRLQLMQAEILRLHKANIKAIRKETGKE